MSRSIKYQIIDAFSSKPFGGNPAAVVVVDDAAQAFLTDDLKQKIAAEINLSETAFLEPSSSDPHRYLLRWWTPSAEVALCGHATLASTAALTVLGRPPNQSTSDYSFDTKYRGTLTGKVLPSDASISSLGKFELDFPADPPVEMTDEAEKKALRDAVDKATNGKVTITKFWKSSDDAVLEVDCHGAHLGDVEVQSGMLSGLPARCIALTTLLPSPPSPTSPLFHTRAFAPDLGIAEDPVTGSLHCCLAVLYTHKLGVQPGTELRATQGGKRRGEIAVVWDEHGGRVKLRGEAVKVASGEMYV